MVGCGNFGIPLVDTTEGRVEVVYYNVADTSGERRGERERRGGREGEARRREEREHKFVLLLVVCVICDE
jgi:hypothetical protein